MQPTIKPLFKSYLFVEYADDDNLQSFVEAYNKIAQQYLDWFNTINLPIYTGLTGALLDWIGQGIYNVPRPALQNNVSDYNGPLNTFAFNQGGMGFNTIQLPTTKGNYVSDDIYKRVLTWQFYKGDGQVFNHLWLKKRILRFIFGNSGRDVAISSLQGIDVTKSTGLSAQDLDITIDTTRLNLFNVNDDGSFSYGTGSSTLPNIVQLSQTLENALNSGACPLPFPFYYHVSVI